MPVRVNAGVFAQVAPGLLFDGYRLTLVGLAPSTIWLSQADPCQLGYLPTGAFLDLWAENDRDRGPDGASMPGSLSLLDPDASVVGSALLKLGSPRISASGLTYDVRVVEGIVPRASGACVLFLKREEPTQPAPMR